jgi:hypothetical protein
MLVPTALGGEQIDFDQRCVCSRSLPARTAAVGWNAGILVGGLFADYLPEEVARRVFRGGAVVAGSFAPGGRGVPADGGYSASGRWAFGQRLPECRLDSVREGAGPGPSKHSGNRSRFQFKAPNRSRPTRSRAFA